MTYKPCPYNRADPITGLTYCEILDKVCQCMILEPPSGEVCESIRMKIRQMGRMK